MVRLEWNHSTTTIWITIFLKFQKAVVFFNVPINKLYGQADRAPMVMEL